MNTLFNTTTVTLIFLALLAPTSEASLRTSDRSPQYINRGGACDTSEIIARMNFNAQFPNEQSIQEACNGDTFCHGYVIMSGNSFYTLNSIGALDNFLLGCNGNAAFLQVKEKREQASHAVTDLTRPNVVCFDDNRHSNVESCRLSKNDCELASSDIQEDCCVCGGGRIEKIVAEVDGDILLPLPGTLSYEIETTASLVLKNNPEKFNGSIPTEIYSLTKLTKLDLSGNGFVGTIPSGIEKLTDLEELTITGNRLQGPLPEALTSLSNLRVVKVEFKGVTSDAERGIF